ncbi:MAG: hypothetical protein AB1746_17185 [Candidatus Zixiibacteriota bacterium]
MRNRWKIFIMILTFAAFWTIPAVASEPSRPDVNRTFDFEKEAKLNELANLSSKDALERLKAIDFVSNEKYLQTAIFRTFQRKKTEILMLALNSLKLPEREEAAGKLVFRTDEIFVAKKVFEAFPEESAGILITIYNQTADPAVRGDIIRVSGKIADGQIRTLLLRALEDKTSAEYETPEMEGKPLRICDIAYNQLVLRYKIRNVLRTIGNAYRTEVRDYHIDVLKSML